MNDHLLLTLTNKTSSALADLEAMTAERFTSRELRLEQGQHEEAFDFIMDHLSYEEGPHAMWVSLKHEGKRRRAILSFEYSRDLGVEGVRFTVKR